METIAHNGGDWFDVEPADGGGWFLRLSPGYPFSEFPDPAEVEANFNANAALIVRAVTGCGLPARTAETASISRRRRLE